MYNCFRKISLSFLARSNTDHSAIPYSTDSHKNENHSSLDGNAQHNCHEQRVTLGLTLELTKNTIITKL